MIDQDLELDDGVDPKVVGVHIVAACASKP
jgi:hypothetical protein